MTQTREIASKLGNVKPPDDYPLGQDEHRSSSVMQESVALDWLQASILPEEDYTPSNAAAAVGSLHTACAYAAPDEPSGGKSGVMTYCK